MLSSLRKTITFDETIYREGQRAVTPPLRMIGVAAMVTTP